MTATGPSKRNCKARDVRAIKKNSQQQGRAFPRPDIMLDTQSSK